MTTKSGHRPKGAAPTDVPALSAAPVCAADVYAVLGGGWRARCECGGTRAVATQEEGWQWVLAHPCQ